MCEIWLRHWQEHTILHSLNILKINNPILFDYYRKIQQQQQQQQQQKRKKIQENNQQK